MRLASILFALTFFIPGMASAESWVPLYTGSSSATFFDRDFRSTEGPNIRIRTLEVFRAPKPLMGRETSAWIMTYVVDCASGVYRVSDISGLTANVEPTSSAMPEVAWKSASAESPAWAVRELACGRDKRFPAGATGGKGVERAAAVRGPLSKASKGAAAGVQPPLPGESWREAVTAKSITIFVDLESRRQEGATWEMMEMRVFDKPVTINRTAAATWILRDAFDCKTRSFTTLGYEALDEGGRRSALVPATPPVWAPAKPGSAAEEVLEIACGEKRPKSRTLLSRSEAIGEAKTR